MRDDDLLTDADGRRWGIDPTGRHPFRQRRTHEWGDLVSDDPQGDAPNRRDLEGGRQARLQDRVKQQPAQRLQHGRELSKEQKQKRSERRGCMWLAGGVAAILALLFVVGWIWNAVFGEESDSTSVSSATVTVGEIRVVNPATVTVELEVNNLGDGSVRPECTVTAQDPSGTYRGFDVFTPTAPVPPGRTTLLAQLTITNEGAAFVTEAEVECD